MKVKIARRFLSRNAWKATNPNKKNSFIRQWQECIATVAKEKRIKNEQKEKIKVIETIET